MIAALRARVGAVAATPAARRLRDAAIRNLKQRSTYEGIPVMLAGFGVALSPHQAAQIVAAGVAVAGLVRTIVPDAEQK